MRSVDSVIHPNAGLPIGPTVDSSAARKPARTTLRGRLVTVAPLDPAAHEEALYQGTHGADREKLWLYLGEGPFPDRASFRAYLEKRSQSDDPLSYAIIHNATGKAAGHASFMRMAPEHRVIEVGNIFYTATLAHSAAGTEAMYLMAKHVFDDLGYRRYEWKCNALNEPSRRAAHRLGFSFEGIFRQHMIQKGRHGLVCDARSWVALAQSQVREVAAAGKLRPKRPAAHSAFLNELRFSTDIGDCKNAGRRKSMKLHCRVNGEEIAAEVEPRLLLSDFIRHELRLTGTNKRLKFS